MSKERLAIVIPTKDRADELGRLLESIANQEVKPVQVVVVDGGRTPLQGVLDRFSPFLGIDYARRIPASLTIQRNVGVRSLREEATLVSFLDDDIVLERECIKNMMKFWEAAPPDVAGVAFNAFNDVGGVYKKATLLEKIFLMNADTPGRILRSGFQSHVCALNETTAVEWIVGCAMVWRRNIFDEFTFDEWFSGYARYEDVDFSYMVGRKYKMYVVADARVRHFNKLEDIRFSYSLGKMQVVNRIYFVMKNRTLSVPLCYWSCFGLFLNNVIKGLLRGDKRYLKRAKGNIAGFMHVLFKPDR